MRMLTSKNCTLLPSRNCRWFATQWRASWYSSFSPAIMSVSRLSTMVRPRLNQALGERLMAFTSSWPQAVCLQSTTGECSTRTTYHAVKFCKRTRYLPVCAKGCRQECGSGAVRMCLLCFATHAVVPRKQLPCCPLPCPQHTRCCSHVYACIQTLINTHTHSRLLHPPGPAAAQRCGEVQHICSCCFLAVAAHGCCCLVRWCSAVAPPVALPCGLTCSPSMPRQSRCAHGPAAPWLM